MEIGGYDLIIDTPVSPETQRSLFLSYLRVLWPNGVLEEDEPSPPDFFFYRNQAAKDSWDKDGRTDENAADMVYVLPRAGQITISHEGLNELEIRKNFYDNSHFM